MNISLRHSVSGVIESFPEDYAESLLEDPHYGQILEIVEEDAPCFDCPPQDGAAPATEPLQVEGTVDIDSEDED